MIKMIIDAFSNKVLYLLKYKSIIQKLLYIFLYFYSISGYSQDIPPKPNPPRLVNDYVGILKPEEVQKLEIKLTAYNDSTSNQIAIVIVKSLHGYDANTMAYKIGEEWGLGQKDKNNGVVLLIKPKTNDEPKGYVAISVGYGLEPYITDALSKRIIQNKLIPYFRQNKFYEGIDAATTAIMLASKGAYKGSPKNDVPPPAGIVFLAIFLLIMFAFIVSVFQTRRRYYTISRHGADDIPFWILMGHMFTSSGTNKDSNWGNFSSGSGSFGGFSGFGGGSFGGGGASGSW